MRHKLSTFVIIFWSCVVAVSPAVAGDGPPAFIFGTVTDKESGEPIPAVNVFIVGTHSGSTTDLKGKFSIGPLRDGFYVIEFSHVAYERIQYMRYLAPGDTVVYNIALAKRSIILEEVKLTAEGLRSTHLWMGTSGRVFTRENIEGTGVRRFGDLVRLMAPGAYVTDMGADLFIDLNWSNRRYFRNPRNVRQNNNPLIILNGMPIGKSPVGLSLLLKPEEIDRIVVLKGIEADMFGYEGRDGIIQIETTPQRDTSGLSLFEKVLYGSAVLGATALASFLLFR